MLITEAPAFPPGSCFITGASDGPFIDTLVDVDDAPNQGRIYLAVSTVESMAQLIGCAPPAAWTRAREQLADQAAKIASLEDQLRALADSNRALLAAGYEQVEPAAEPKPELEVPAGSVPAVLAWVYGRHPAQGQDDSIEGQVARAWAALEAEADEDAPRVTLVTELEAFIEKAREEVPA